jgi:CheY-like chemotaxis protein
VYLPIIEQTEKSEIVNQAAFPTGRERILLVDDEEAIVKLERQMLERLGYRVTARYSSSEALKAFEMNPSAYDMVITDLSMPNMTGIQLARKMLALRPDLPIIICTGFSERFNQETANAMGVKGLLKKPVAKVDMANMIRKVLDAE